MEVSVKSDFSWASIESDFSGILEVVAVDLFRGMDG